MSIRSASGQPFTGYVQLTNGAPAADIPIYVIAGAGTAYTPLAVGSPAAPNGERLLVTAVLFSTNDTAMPLVQITDKATTPKVLASAYVVNTQPNAPMTFPPGIVLGRFGSLIRAVANAITAAKTVEVTIWGTISQT